MNDVPPWKRDMPESERDLFKTVSIDPNRQIDALCDRFEKAWKSGTPQLEQYLADATENLRPATFGELLQVEIELRER